MTLASTLGADLSGILKDLPGSLGERAPALALRFEAAFQRPAFKMTIVRGGRSAEVRCHRHRRALVGFVEAVTGFKMTSELLAEMADSLATSGGVMVMFYDPAGGHFAFSDGDVMASCSVETNPYRN
jgi:hypothetical protein